MLGLPSNERIEMGKRGREKIIREFDEKIIIKKYFSDRGTNRIIDYTLNDESEKLNL